MIFFILLTTIFGTAYYFPTGIAFLPHGAGFTLLCYWYQARRHKNLFKQFIFPCWLSFFAVYSIFFSWLWLHEATIYFLSLLIFPLIIPLIFFAHHLLTRRSRSLILATGVAFGIFYVAESLMSLIPALGTISLDSFFQPPDAALCVLKFMTFKVWSACLFATCYALSGFFWEKKMKNLFLAGAMAGTLTALVILAHTQNVLAEKSNEKRRTVKLALIQANLPYTEKWPESFIAHVKKKYTELALKAAVDSPDLIIFPLYDLPGDVYREPFFLEELSKKATHPILVAVDVPVEAGDEDFDSGYKRLAILYGPDGALRDIYQAVQATPLTYQHVETAQEYHTLNGPFGKLGILLCYEDTLPRLSRQAARDGAKVLVALSNPGLFQKTPLLGHHLFQDQIRAAETGLPLVRVSANGYSALIDRTGKIVQKSNPGTEEILRVSIPLYDDINATT